MAWGGPVTPIYPAVDFEADPSLDPLAIEWVEPDGLGGFAMGTASLIATRRYHGLLTVARHPPVDRRHLLAGLDERRLEDARPGPHLTTRVRRVLRDPLLRFQLELEGADLERGLVAIPGRAAVLLWWRWSGPAPLPLALRPQLTGRGFHDLCVRNPLADPQAEVDGDRVRLRPYQDEPEVWIRAPGARFVEGPTWDLGREYPRERARGYQFREDLLVPGHLELVLEPGDDAFVLVSAEAPDPRQDLRALRDQVAASRRLRIERGAEGDPADAVLAEAARAFLVRRDPDAVSCIAGYPWFEDWGRDTLISLPALVAAQGDALRPQVLATFAARIERGLVPNRCGPTPEDDLHNAADASLWFVLEAGKVDLSEHEDLWRGCLQIFDAYRAGTRHGIRVDPADGLVVAAEPGTQLTWMDAKVDEVVITPRAGKPVELQALWMNACEVVRREAARRGLDERAAQAQAARDQVAASFEATFYSELSGTLADVVGTDGRRDAQVRPNQVLALSLPLVPLEAEKARRVLEVVDRELLTPFGLRTLAPGARGYRGRYAGDIVERDHAYHQGTVWPWLLGPYGRACLRFRGPGERARLDELLGTLLEWARTRGLGSLPEVFDGDPPHLPGGCPAQAWSVAEVMMLHRLVRPPRPWSPSSY